MFHALVRRIGVVAHRGANAGDLIRRNRYADTRPADENAARCFASLQGLADPLSKVRIVVLRIAGKSAKIDHLVTSLGEIGAHLFLEVETGV